jgi:nitrogen fixation negative regulator NifL
MSAAGYFTQNGRSGLLLVASDITLQRRRYEQARTNAVRALMAEQQMLQGMREVISGAIFQLQGPLNVMSAAAQMMDRQSDGDGVLRAPIHEVLNAGNAALERLKAAMPRVTDEAVEPVNVNELVREVLDVSIERLLREGIFVDWRPAAKLPNVPGRANALRSMIKHLVDNAILAIKDGGTGREIMITSGVMPSGEVKLEIRDFGPGLEGDLRLKIYEPFFTAWKKTRSCTGMGLVLARQIVTDQGGSLEIENVMSGGCKAEVVFAAASMSFEHAYGQEG